MVMKKAEKQFFNQYIDHVITQISDVDYLSANILYVGFIKYVESNFNLDISDMSIRSFLKELEPALFELNYVYSRSLTSKSGYDTMSFTNFENKHTQLSRVLELLKVEITDYRKTTHRYFRKIDSSKN